VAAVVTLAVCAALGAFFKYTDMGIAIRASAENGERASLLGIPIHRVSTVVWVVAAVMSAIAVFLRAPVSGLTLGSSIGPSVLLYGLACAVIARMENLPMCVAAGMGIGIIDQAALFGTRRSSLAIATMLVVILAALLLQKGKMARALDAGVSTWQAAKEYRPIPFELRNIKEVVMARGAIANLVLFIAVIFPLIADEKYAGRFTIVVITAMVGVSLVMLTGWGGQISLGQFGFAGLGAMVTAGLAVREWDFFVCLAVAGLVGALAAVLIGLPALRIQGPFLAVTTLSFAFTVQYFFLNPSYFDWFLPASGDFVTRPKLYGFFSTTSDIRFYFVCLTFLALSLLLARSMRKNRFGRILIGVRDNPKGVQAYGVNLARTKLAAFAISGFVAAVAGGLFTYYLQSVDANTYDAPRSITVFTIAVIGGLTSLPGVHTAHRGR
jgi:branched-chain amino acid transport system permease protein